jgi:tetratricopeptide (TPR) repeat protein
VAPTGCGIEVTALIGTGAFGSVWEASIDLASGRRDRVAVKVSHSADPASENRCRREAAVLEGLGPPHVPALFASGALPDGRMYLAMERLSGRNLAEEIADFSAPPGLDVFASLGGALLEAANALHTHGVYHRDLKPENVFLVRAPGGRPVAKLIDFGLALAGVTSPEPRTSSDLSVGTPEYMAPERIMGEPGDLRSDVYALGIMLFELATLRPPFVGEGRELEYAQLSFRPPRPSRFAVVPGALEAVILRCLVKDPSQRFADAVALQAAFARALAVRDSEPQAPARQANRETAAGGGSLQQAALIFIHEPRAAMEIQAVVQPFGGQLAHLTAGRGVCAFTHRAGDHPGRRALAAAEAIAAAGLARRMILDVGGVTVRPRPGRLPRLSSSLFSQSARYPTDRDAEAILITAAARETLPAVSCEPARGRPDHFIRISAPGHRGSETIELTVRDAADSIFGRDRDLQVLVAEAGRALADAQPRAASVLGGPGIGKTRLCSELGFLLRNQMPAAEVITLSAREVLGHEGEDALAELLRRTLDLPRQRPEDGGRKLLFECLGKTSEAAAAGLLLGWMTPHDPEVRSLGVAPGVLPANAARAGSTALQRLAERRPVIVLLDDAQWADEALLDALEQAMVAKLPLWVCAFSGPAFATTRPNWGQRAAHAYRLHLGPLDRASAGALCRHLLEPAAYTPEQVIDRLVDRTEGVPFLIHDLIRGLRREGLVRQQVAGSWVVASEVLDRIPDSPLTQWLASRELDELPAELAAHAHLLSLLPFEFTIEEVEGVVGAMEGDLLDAFPIEARVGTERLKQSGLLVRRRTGRLTFRSEVMREKVASLVSEVHAVRIHQAALDYYRGAPLPVVIRLGRLAWHAAATGKRSEAAVAYSTLAEGARERHSYLEAELLYTRTLAQLDETDQSERLRALKGRGVMRYRLGRLDDSRADLAQAREIAMRGGDLLSQADVVLDESMALDWLNEWPRSRELAELARTLVPRDAPPVLEARVLLALGRSLYRFNREAEAAELLREAERLAQAAGDDGYEVRVVADLLLGYLLPRRGFFAEAEDRLRKVQLLCEEKGDELHLAGMWSNRACVWIARNDRERFLEDTARVQAYARRLGSAYFERVANHNAALFFYWRGEFDAALPFVRRMVEVQARHFRDATSQADGSVLLARILWGQGVELEARKLVEELRARQATAQAQGSSARLLPNDEMLLDMTSLLIEGGSAAEWEDLVARGRVVGEDQEPIEVLELAGVAALRQGDPESARRWWREALEVGQRIPNVMGERIRGRLSALGRDVLV